jgi:nitrite reductase/ring-hydroxylating ferredoxin subunit
VPHDRRPHRADARGGSRLPVRVVVAPVDDFEPGDRRIISVGGRSIGVFRIGDRFYAVRNRCPHQGGPLCLGRVSPFALSDGPGDFRMDDDSSLLACPWHGWEYDLATGQSFLGPGEPRVRSYDVSVQRGSELAVEEPPTRHGRVPGPYVAETFPVRVEEDYVVIEA